MDIIDKKNYTLQNQYQNTNIETFLNHIDTIFKENSKNLINYFKYNIYDLENASGSDLDLWGALLNIPRNVPSNDKILVVSDRTGFSFGRSNFYHLQFNALTKKDYIILSDLAYKLLIKLKILLMTTDCNIESLNNICKVLFKDLGGTAEVLDNEDMSMRYVFNFELPVWFKYILELYPILPKPAGVLATYIENIVYYFGFAGQDPERTGNIGNFRKTIFHKHTWNSLIAEIRAYKPKIIPPTMIQPLTCRSTGHYSEPYVLYDNVTPAEDFSKYDPKP